MGCIQSYFKKAASGSAQASPTDVVKHIIEQEQRRTELETVKIVPNVVSQEPSKVVPIVSPEEISKEVPQLSPDEQSAINDDELDSEAAECGSLHCVEATAVRTLAASTGTVAILGTTAKYKEAVEYSRRSVHSDQGCAYDYGGQEDSYSIAHKHEPVAAVLLLQDGEYPSNNEPLMAATPVAVASNNNDSTAKSNNIVTTVTIEQIPPPAKVNALTGPKMVVISKACPADNINNSSSVQMPAPLSMSTMVMHNDTNQTVENTIKYLPKVIEVTKKECMEEGALTIAPQTSPTSVGTEMITKSRLSGNNPTTWSIASSSHDRELSDNEIEDREISDKTNENSEKESTSSEVISIVHKEEVDKEEEDDNDDDDEKACSSASAVLHKQKSFDFQNMVTRPNRLSLGQQSVESDQNTMEISSADDVVKNVSTDMTSPDSLREMSLEELLAKEKVVSPNADSKGDIESWKSEKDPKEISNTSLNTLGDDSEEAHSEFDADSSREHANQASAIFRRFDTISSNGESSYRPEEHNYPSVTEVPELEEYASNQNFILDSPNEEVFDAQLLGEEHRRLKENAIRESAAEAIDRICEQAVESVAVMMNDDSASVAKQMTELVDDMNNMSESSLLSAVDSVVAEKGSDFDSLSLVDEQSEHSRCANVFGSADQTKDQQRLPELSEVHHHSVLAQEGAEKRLRDSGRPSLDDTSGTVITQEDISLNDTEKTTLDSVSEDLPKPPDIEDFPPLPENLDQFDITEDELKAVQLPDSAESDIASSKNSPVDSLLEAAASKIQAGIRGYLTRKQLKDLTKNNEQNESDTFDLDTKNYVKNKRLSLDSKLGDFENIRKLPKLKSTLSECVEEESSNTDYEKAAMKIQSTFRNYRARKSICLGDAHRKIINGGSVMRETKNGVGDNEQTLTVDDKLDLSIKTVNELEPLIEENKKLREETANADDDSLKKAVVKIQATYRGFRTRKSIQMSASAATKIQAHFRGYKVRKSLKRSSSLNDLRNSASSSCSNMSSQQELEKQITKIQAGVRGYLVRKRHSLQNVAAAKIQMNYRKYKSRKQFKAKN